MDIAEAQFLTDQGDTVVAFRPYTPISFLGRHGQLIPIRAMIDSCAPFSVVPYQLWNTHGFAWSSISKTLTRRGKATGLDWHGVPCELGYAEIDLAGPRKLIAKFTLRPTSTTDAILGANFLADNDIEFALRGAGGGLSGFLSVPWQRQRATLLWRSTARVTEFLCGCAWRIDRRRRADYTTAYGPSIIHPVSSRCGASAHCG